MKRKNAGPSVEPLLIVALVAVVAVSGMFVMGSGSSFGGGLTGAQVANLDVTPASTPTQDECDKAASPIVPMGINAESSLPPSPGWRIWCKGVPSADESGTVYYCYAQSVPEGCENTKPPIEEDPPDDDPGGDHPEDPPVEPPDCNTVGGASTTGNAFAIGGKGAANWLILGTVLGAVVLLGILVRQGSAKSKKAKKTRALLLAGILVLAIVAGGLVLLKPATRGKADSSGDGCAAEEQMVKELEKERRELEYEFEHKKVDELTVLSDLGVLQNQRNDLSEGLSTATDYFNQISNTRHNEDRHAEAIEHYNEYISQNPHLKLPAYPSNEIKNELRGLQARLDSVKRHIEKAEEKLKTVQTAIKNVIKRISDLEKKQENANYDLKKCQEKCSS